MNPGDFMKNFSEIFSRGGQGRAAPRSEGVRLLEQATLGFTPDAPTLPGGALPQSGALYKAKGKLQKAKGKGEDDEPRGLRLLFLSFAFCLLPFALLIHCFLVN
jgi:hypothetical protein